MINIVLPSLRPPKPPTQITHHPHTAHSTEPVATLFKEAQRRDSIIKRLAAECPYKVGDIVMPSIPENEAEYGTEIIIIRIIDTYGKYGRNEPWPSSDKPMIVYARAIKPDCYFFCTTNYLKVK
jgi:hypothetical protein